MIFAAKEIERLFNPINRFLFVLDLIHDKSYEVILKMDYIMKGNGNQGCSIMCVIYTLKDDEEVRPITLKQH